MTQPELYVHNRILLSKFTEILGKQEVVVAMVTVRLDGKGLGWYPADASKSGIILDMLRKKPDEIIIERLR